MCIYRAPMRARDLEVPRGAGAEYGLAARLVGIGAGSGDRAAQLVHRFATVPIGAFVWTRDRAGRYHLGRITGDMREDRSPAARTVGIAHVRDTRWLARAFPETDVPAAVARTFARGGRNFQRTHDPDAERMTAEIWQHQFQRPRVGFVGLGRMGMPMCVRLLRAGFDVAGYDRRGGLESELKRAGGRWARSVGAAAERAEVLITMLPGPREVDGVIDEVSSALGAGSTWLDMSTAAPGTARAIVAATRPRAIHFLDAPVGGGPASAETGALIAFVGGDQAVLEEHRQLLDVLADRVIRVGDAGAGYTVKLLVNLLWFGQAIASAEVLTLAEKAGIDLDVMRDAVGHSAAASRFMDHDAGALLAGDSMSSFALMRCCEQLDTVLGLGSDMDLALELAAVVSDLYKRALARYGDVDGELLGARFVAEEGGLLRRD